MLTAPPWTRKHFWLCSPSLQMLKFLGQQNTHLVSIMSTVNFCVYFRDLMLRFFPSIWFYSVLNTDRYVSWYINKGEADAMHIVEHVKIFWCSFATVILCDDMRSVWPSRSLALLARLQTQRQVNPLGVCGLTTQYTPHTNISPMCLCVWIFHKSLGCCLSENSMYMSLVSRKLIIISFQSIIKISWTGSMLIIALHPWW